MGIRRTDDDANWPADGDPEPDRRSALPDLPELPTDWGGVPDDPSELAIEAEVVRRELAASGGRVAPRIDAGAPPDENDAPSVGVPLLIMAMAVLVTMVSLFAMAWSTPGPQPSSADPSPLPAVTLTDSEGRLVPLTTLAPAAILLVEECDCADLVAETVAAAPPGVTVAVVDTDAGRLATSDLGDGARWLSDPEQATRAALGLSPPTGAAATVLLVNRDREIIYSTRAASAAAFQSPLAALAT